MAVKGAGARNGERAADYVRIDTFTNGVGHWSMDAWDIERLGAHVRATGQGHAALVKAQNAARATLADRRWAEGAL